MVIHFKLRFKSYFGQSVAVLLKEVNKSSETQEVFHELSFADEEHWSGSVQFNTKVDKISYHYIIREQGKTFRDHWYNRELSGLHAEVFLYDDWLYHPIETAVFNSKAFKSVLLKENNNDHLIAECHHPTHVIKVRTTRLQEGKSLCLLGSSPSLGSWDATKLLRLSNENNVWSISLNLSKDDTVSEYKLAVCDTATGKLECFEESFNRIIHHHAESTFSVSHLYATFKNAAWRAAGLNVQLSSLKSYKSWGVGDFTDLHLLTDWVSACGMKMIQLLPINDTTSTFTKADSYPYSAISAFALHPIFLNVEDMAAAYKIKLQSSLIEKAKQFNQSPSLIYDEVYLLKKEASMFVFQKIKDKFLKEKSFVSFFNEHRHWLVPYASFCCLRDHFKTADFGQWEEYAVYDDKKIQELTDVKSMHHTEVAYNYFVQYHLHLQLSSAVSYAHKAGVVMKGDLPIGVGRYSMDTWMNPSLFHMDMQAGAPPDAFTKKGQNWFFPTYNWDSMKATNYAWWRQRLTHMSHYFDATRVDHVLGFFRIWSVPMHAIEGIFGIFVPSIALSSAEFTHAGIFFDESRFCDPFINDDRLNQIFGDQVRFVREQFLDGNSVKEHFNTQRKIEDFAGKQLLDPIIKQALFDMLADVILFRDPVEKDKYHFRIDIHDTHSFRNLPGDVQEKLHRLYINYFYERQNGLWYEVAQQKLDAIQQSSDMLICAEDLGMVPEMVEGVLRSREMLALQVQRMPKKSNQQFSHPADAPYLSVVTPSTHDMSTIRQWWEEDAQVTQRFYNDLLSQPGQAPQFCEPEICRSIILQHLQSPAMWSIFLIQDLLAMDSKTRRQHPNEERINNPADPHHYWNYRMHINLEELITHDVLTSNLHHLISDTHRC